MQTILVERTEHTSRQSRQADKQAEQTSRQSRQSRQNRSKEGGLPLIAPADLIRHLLTLKPDAHNRVKRLPW